MLTRLNVCCVHVWLIQYFVELWRNRASLNPFPRAKVDKVQLVRAVFYRERHCNKLKFLYDSFAPRYYWYEVVECARKLLLTGFVVRCVAMTLPLSK